MALSDITLKRLFEGYFILRWNDWIHPIPLVEMDRHGHRMMLAFLMGHIQEKNDRKIDWSYLIVGGTFHLLRKLVFSDLKPAVSSRLYKNNPQVIYRMNQYVLSQAMNWLDAQSAHLLGMYVQEDPEISYPATHRKQTYRLLRAASKLVTLREFQLLKRVNLEGEEVYRIEREILDDLYAYTDIEPLNSFLFQRPIAQFNQIIEKLRYQRRWSQMYKVPVTSVMGHSAFVATLSWFLVNHILHSRGLLYPLDATPPVVICTYFAALFHDLAEAVTRDIVRPVKEWFIEALQEERSLRGVDAYGREDTESYDKIKAIEDELLQEALALLREEGVPHLETILRYFSQKEFTDRCMTEEGGIQKVDDHVLLSTTMDVCPVWGRIIDLADNLAAYVEARQSVEMGVRPEGLVRAVNGIRSFLEEKAHQGELVFAGVDLGPLVQGMFGPPLDTESHKGEKE